MKEKILSDETAYYYQEHCFTCGHKIANDEPCRFSWEWDAWICDECYERIKKNENLNPEEQIIAKEFFGIEFESEEDVDLTEALCGDLHLLTDDK